MDEITEYKFGTENVFEEDAKREKEGLHQAIENSQLGTIVDLSNVNYLSTEGLGLLINAHEKAKKSNRTLAITGIQTDSVRSVFETTRMNGYLNTYETPEKAEQALRK